MLDVVLDVCWMYVGCVLDGCWMTGGRPDRHSGSDRGSSPHAVSNLSEAAHSKSKTMQLLPCMVCLTSCTNTFLNAKRHQLLMDAVSRHCKDYRASTHVPSS
jgi:hypothetical protein